MWSSRIKASRIMDLIIKPLAINKASIRCELLASEESILPDHDPQIFVLKFRRVQSFHNWNPDDAALIINWKYINKGFKKDLFHTVAYS